MAARPTGCCWCPPLSCCVSQRLKRTSTTSPPRPRSKPPTLTVKVAVEGCPSDDDLQCTQRRRGSLPGFPPVLYSGNTTVDNNYTPEVGQGDVIPRSRRGGGSPCHVTERGESLSTSHCSRQLYWFSFFLFFFLFLITDFPSNVCQASKACTVEVPYRSDLVHWHS